ncbi:hypothetical protein KQI68_06500 [Peptoniphilus sp. MSJ-1]|uniref:Uncharacterized protein n=1 Tax=Peptoniphilus ovalis TaxID=2841503 RepID=A0ABS6FH34_9FIRM|nr:hypothetical protein [Peptoniphilus ovalis]MBU5669487.1 hypothetical protein [Peptoniphilus ovalis]
MKIDNKIKRITSSNVDIKRIVNGGGILWEKIIWLKSNCEYRVYSDSIMSTSYGAKTLVDRPWKTAEFKIDLNFARIYAVKEITLMTPSAVDGSYGVQYLDFKVKSNIFRIECDRTIKKNNSIIITLGKNLQNTYGNVANALDLHYRIIE